MSGNKCPIVSIYNVKSKALEKKIRDKLSDFGLNFYDDDHAVQYQKRTHVYITFHPTEESTYFTKLCGLPADRRRRWLHFKNAEHINSNAVWACFLSASLGYTMETTPTGDPIPEYLRIKTGIVPLDPQYLDEEPLVSIFTTTYRSKDKIFRVVKSLLRQLYVNWELVILDDSNDEGNTFNGVLNSLPKDPRIRRYFPGEASGYIGEVKKLVCGLCKGKILFEMDHDDEIEPDCVRKIVHAFKTNPDAGFVYGDGAEIYEGKLTSHEYPEGFGLGYGSYYHQFSVNLQRWVKVCRTTDLNNSTLVDIVGVPNHPRVWRTDFYHAIGGHNPDLSVADDYELVLRTFLRTRMVRVPTLMYLQYRNEGGNNFTFLRNELIRRLQSRISWHYRSTIEGRIKSMGLPLERHDLNTPIWKVDDSVSGSLGSKIRRYGNGTLYSEGNTKVILIKKGSVVKLLPKKFEPTDYVVVVSYGNHTLVAEEMGNYPLTPDNVLKIRWWVLKTENREEALRYAKLMLETHDYEVIDA